MTRQDGPVALAGLGNMGSAVAGRLAERFRVLGFDVDPRRRADAAERYKIAVVEDVALLAQASILVLSLPTPEISATVVRTLLADLPPGTLIVETSTVNPTDMWRLRDVCSPAGVRVVDGAILSGVAQMAAGRSTLLVGGKAEDLDAAAGVFAALAPRVLRFGDVGSGMAEVFVRLRGPSMIGFSIYFAFEIVQISIAPGMCGIFLARP
jgi:3-hydroxyisobutyrate dehydrogenase